MCCNFHGRSRIKSKRNGFKESPKSWWNYYKAFQIILKYNKNLTTSLCSLKLSKKLDAIGYYK